jgi:hypothetical protein
MLDALRSDHAAIAAILADSANTLHTDAALEQREELVINLVGHFVAEEQYLYPAVREHVDGGHTLAELEFEVDRGMEHQLKGLEDDDLTPERLAVLWGVLHAGFAEHIERQERLFTQLAATLTPAQLAELGDGIAGAEQLAPTRPRGFTIESPGANKVISFVEGFVDRARDYYTKRGAE